MTAPAQTCPMTGERRDGGIILRFSEGGARLDEQATEAFRAQVLPLIDDSSPPRLTLDFANVRFLSSTTLGVLVGLRKKLQPLGGQLTLANLRPELYDLFVVTQLDRMFDFRQDDPEPRVTKSE